MATTYIDIHMTRARIIRNPPGTGDDVDYFVDIPADGPIDLVVPFSHFVYPSEYDGIEHDVDPDAPVPYIPETPAGGTLVEVRSFIKAWISDGSQTTIVSDTSDWGFTPAPTLTPFLTLNHSFPTVYEDFPTSEPADVILCPSPMLGSQYQAALYVDRESHPPPPFTLTLSDYGWRFTYEVDAPPAGPSRRRRLFQRPI